MKPNNKPITNRLLFLAVAQVWIAASPASHAQALTDLNSVSVLPTGNYPISAAGETFDGYVHNDGTHSWLLVGRGRDGWEFDNDGQGSPANVGVQANLGTPSAFVPALYSDAIINDLITNAGADLTGVEIRIRRAGDSTGTAPYQEARWRPDTRTTWTGAFDDVDGGGAGYTVEYEILSGVGSPVAPVATNTRDAGPNNFGRIFTWSWGGHAADRDSTLETWRPTGRTTRPHFGGRTRTKTTPSPTPKSTSASRIPGR